MPLQTSSRQETPYHLRAARLRWEAFAVNLEDDEKEWMESILSTESAPLHSQSMAKLLLCLHQREEISKLCLEHNLSRRRLLDLADRLTSKEGRRLLMSQPLPTRGRPRRVN